MEFRQIHDSFRPRILRYLTRLLGERDAEDLTQEVLVKISRSIQSFREESSLSTWIYRIATNTALDRLRSPDYKRKVDEIPGIGKNGDEIEDLNLWSGRRTPPLDQQLIRKEMNECIKGLVEKLPEDNRTVLVLSEFEGLKNREIAEILGITLDAVKIRLHRARAEIRRKLEDYCSFYRDERNELACDKKPTIIKFR